MINKIDERRKVLGYSQRKLSKMLGVSQPVVSRLCNGKLDSLKISIVKKLSAILGLTIEEIYHSAQGNSNV